MGQGKEDKVLSGNILHIIVSSPKFRYDIFFSVGGCGTAVGKYSENRICTCSHL